MHRGRLGSTGSSLHASADEGATQNTCSWVIRLFRLRRGQPVFRGHEVDEEPGPSPGQLHVGARDYGAGSACDADSGSLPREQLEPRQNPASAEQVPAEVVAASAAFPLADDLPAPE